MSSGDGDRDGDFDADVLFGVGDDRQRVTEWVCGAGGEFNYGSLFVLNLIICLFRYDVRFVVNNLRSVCVYFLSELRWWYLGFFALFILIEVSGLFVLNLSLYFFVALILWFIIVLRMFCNRTSLSHMVFLAANSMERNRFKSN